MNNLKNSAAYESPVTELLTLELEGAVLTGSTNSAKYNSFTQGSDLNF